MRIDHSYLDDVVIMTLVGNLMGETDWERMQNAISKHTDKGYKRYVWDLSKVTYINSTGLGILVDAWHKIRKYGGTSTVVLTNNERIDNILTITNVKRIMDMHSDLDAAVSAVRKDKVY